VYFSFELLELYIVKLAGAYPAQPLKPLTNKTVADLCFAGPLEFHNIRWLTQGETKSVKVIGKFSLRVDEFRGKDLSPFLN